MKRPNPVLVADGYIGVIEAARLVGVCHETVRRWIRSGVLPGRLVGEVWHVLPADVRAAQRLGGARDATGA